MKNIKRKFKCNGCGEERPCFVESNQEDDNRGWDDIADELNCILDETNQSTNWKEIDSKPSDTETQQSGIGCMMRVTAPRLSKEDIKRFKEEMSKPSKVEFIAYNPPKLKQDIRETEQ